MKSNILKTLLVSVFITGFFFACNKKDASVKENPKSAKVLAITVGKGNANSRLAPVCSGHGGQIGIGTSWDIATCRSDCERGIGFRCGRETYAICQDGTHVTIQQNLGGCNGGGVIIYEYSRRMNAVYEFYEGGTAKIIFQNSMPDSELDNVDFEVEGDQSFELPENLLIGGVSYDHVVIREGTYEIDYSDGSYGSVIVNVDLVE